MNRTRTLVTLALASLLLASVGGCGGRPDGPERFELEGTVTYRGAPVPAGTIIFSPDPAENNSGPQSLATITDGRFRTVDDKGHVGGSHRIELFGSDGVPATIDGILDEKGTPLFSSWKSTVELPREEGKIEIVVPDDHR